MPRYTFNPWREVRKGVPLTPWQLHYLISGSVSVYTFLLAGKKVDLRTLKRDLRILKKARTQFWDEVASHCIHCKRKMRPGTGTKTRLGWRIHTWCMRKEYR